MIDICKMRGASGGNLIHTLDLPVACRQEATESMMLSATVGLFTTLHTFHCSPLTCEMLLTECYLVFLALYHFNIMHKVKMVAQIDT